LIIGAGRQSTAVMLVGHHQMTKHLDAAASGTS
jgi:hypothetical protein